MARKTMNTSLKNARIFDEELWGSEDLTEVNVSGFYFIDDEETQQCTTPISKKLENEVNELEESSYSITDELVENLKTKAQLLKDLQSPMKDDNDSRTSQSNSFKSIKNNMIKNRKSPYKRNFSTSSKFIDGINQSPLNENKQLSALNPKKKFSNEFIVQSIYRDELRLLSNSDSKDEPNISKNKRNLQKKYEALDNWETTPFLPVTDDKTAKDINLRKRKPGDLFVGQNSCKRKIKQEPKSSSFNDKRNIKSKTDYSSSSSSLSDTDEHDTKKKMMGQYSNYSKFNNSNENIGGVKSEESTSSSPDIRQESDTNVQKTTMNNNFMFRKVNFSGFPLRKKKRVDYETDPDILRRRQKQIDYGKNTIGYDNYRKLIPKQKRHSTDPQTPNKMIKYSRRGWDGLIKQWRLKLHKYDPVDNVCLL